MDLTEFIIAKRRATERQIKFATEIADELGLEYPNFDSFLETANFIDDNMWEFYNSHDYRG